MPSAWCPPPEGDGRLLRGLRSAARPRFRRDHNGRLRLPRGPVVVLVDRQGVYARPARLGERLASHLRATGLDQALARGASPEGQALLALRAQQLASPAARREACQCVDRLLHAESGRWPRHPAAPTLQLERVAASRHELEELRDALSAPAPVSVRGVAMVRILLTDGGGPLYRSAARTDLRTAITQAVRALSVSPFGDGAQPV